MRRPDERILLVDDEPRVLSGLRRRLSDRFHVLTAESAAEAVNVLEGGDTVGAILADMRMPERNGVDLLAEVARRWPEIRRLMLTGNTDQETAMAAVNAGRVFRFFRKPCDADQLADALGEALEEYRFATRSAGERRILEIQARAGDAARRSFLSMMSHELLTPLNHVLGFSAMLEMKLQQQSEPEAMEYLSYIKGAGEDLVRMVHRVLEIARITSSDLQRERHMFDVKAIIMEHVERIRAKAFARGVTVSFQAAPQPLIVNSSEHEIQLALTELLDNALKFNRDYGHIAVAAGCANGEVTIRIADTGTGMEKSTAENALGVFFADDKEPLHSRGNIGLGLTLVALFAQSNQGRLAIESERDVGTAIMLSLASAAEDYVLLSA
jgi:signal transduction histidine kinase